jgi:hypothetical protein
MGLILSAIAAWTQCSTPGAAQQAAVEPLAKLAPLEADEAAFYRYDPFLQEMIPVPRLEIKPGYLYTRRSEQLGRRVWSIARADGGFDYAMAPGSVQPAWRLDLRASAERQRAELEARAPEMAQIMDIRGERAHVKLDDAGVWQLATLPTIPSVYDLQTLRRWEWHGQRRVAVVHTDGYEWSVVRGKYSPAFVLAPAWVVGPTWSYGCLR